MLWAPAYAMAAFAFSVSARYNSVESPSHPGESIRYKSFDDGQLCNGGSRHYAGWVDIAATHIFYWYHPARNVTNAPLLIWLQGGPGGSSLAGMLLENGPCIITPDNTTTFNPYAWTESYNVVYVDQPVGVGFSYSYDRDRPASKAALPTRTEEAAFDFISVLRMLPHAFPELDGLPIHIAGESFAGRYIPEFGSAVLKYNANSLVANRIPLASLMIGNGLTSMREQIPALFDTGCFEHYGIPPVMNKSECDVMAAQVDRFERISIACELTPDPIICAASGEFALSKFMNSTSQKLWNGYNRIQHCPRPGDCYPLMSSIVALLNSEEVREALEISLPDFGADITYDVENGDVLNSFLASGDFATSSKPALQHVLSDGAVQVLIYAGVNDWMVPSIGVRRMLDGMQWEHHAEFRALPLEPLPWSNKEGGIAGYTKKVDRLHYVEVTGAGHLVPLDQPESMLTMVKKWRVIVEQASQLKSSPGPTKHSIIGVGKNDQFVMSQQV